MATKRLRAVGPDEAPAPAKKLSITEAAREGTVRQQLEALRDRIAKAVEDPNCSTRDLASLSKRLMEITKEIEAIDAKADEESHGAAATPDEAWQAV
jgi:chromosome segregation ATPase